MLLEKFNQRSIQHELQILKFVEQTIEMIVKYFPMTHHHTLTQFKSNHWKGFWLLFCTKTYKIVPFRTRFRMSKNLNIIYFYISK